MQMAFESDNYSKQLLSTIMNHKTGKRGQHYAFSQCLRILLQWQYSRVFRGVEKQQRANGL